MNPNFSFTIRQETPADFFAVENLTRDAFWNIYRPGCVDHCVLHRYRSRPEFIPELSLVLETASREILAHIMFSQSEIMLDEPSTPPRKSLPIMTFGPFSVRPDKQRQGIGKHLLEFALNWAKEMGAGCIAICGNIQFYGKCGFELAKDRGIRYADDPNAPYFLLKELVPGFLTGVRGTYRDPDGYFVSETEVEEFDRLFPYKEKKVLPGQL